MRRHINATTAQARNKGLEGAAPGTSASLIYTDHKGRTIEGRQPYPVRVYADGAYVGILNPGETIDTFAASRIDEVPVMEDGTVAKNVDLTDTRDFEKKKVGSDAWLNRVIAEQNDRGNPISIDQAKEFQSFVLTELDKGQSKSLGFEDWITMSEQHNIPYGTQGFNITTPTTWDPNANMFVPDPSGTDNNMMFFDEWEDGNIGQWVKTHELGHNWNTEIPFKNNNNDFLGSTYFSDTDMFNEFARNQGEEFGDRHQDYAHYKHQEHEIRSEKAAFERALADAGLWDPTKEFTSEDLRNILNNRGKLGYEAREIFKALGGTELAERDYNIKELEYFADGQHLTPELQKLKDEIEGMYTELGSRFNPSINMDANTWASMSGWEKEKYIEEHGTTPVQKGEDYDGDGVLDNEWTEDMTDKQKNAYLRSQARYAEIDKWGDNAVYGTNALSAQIDSPGMFAYNNEDITEGLDAFNTIAGGFEMPPPLKEIRNAEGTLTGYTDDPDYIGLGEPNNVIPVSDESTAQFNNQSNPVDTWNSYVDDLFTANETFEEDRKKPWRERDYQSSWNLKIDESLDYVDAPKEGDEDYDPENPLVSNNLYDKCYDENGNPTGNCNEQELKRIKDNDEIHNSWARMERINYTLQSLGDVFGSSTATHIEGSNPFDPNARGVVKTSLNSPLTNNKFMELYPEGTDEHSAMLRIMKTYDRLSENAEDGKKPTMDREAFTLEFFNDLSLVQQGLINTRQVLEIDRQDKVDNYYKLLQEHLDKGSEQQIQEQKDLLNQDIENHKIINFMNKVYSQNDQDIQQATQFAKQGGPIKYQDASNVIKDKMSQKWNTFKDDITNLPKNIKNEWNKLKNQSFPIPEIGISAIDDKLRGHVITPMQEIRNAKTGEVNEELTEFLDKNYSNLLKIYNNTYDWKNQSWYEKIGSITGSLSSLFQISKENSKSGTFDFYENGSDVQIQEPNLDIQADSTAVENPPVESIFSQEELDYVDFIQNRKPYRDGTTIGDDAEMFYLDLYNTELTADELLEYYVWKDTLAQRRSLLNNTSIAEELARLDMDLGAYDIQGFWKSGDYKNTDSDGHGSDKWKKPNHPTFSNESKYASNYELPDGEEDNRSEYEGGIWNSDGGYVPSMHNMYSNKRLHSEFNREPHRNEFLYLGNDLIYQQNLVPSNLIPTIGPANLENIDLNFQKEIPYKYQDASEVKMQNPNLFISEPNTVEMDEKFTKMYRDQDEELLNKLTFDGSTEEGMIDFLKFTENGIAKGYRKNDKGEMRWFPHKDSKGIWTIGYGHNMEAAGETLEQYKNGLTDAEVEELLKSDIKVHTDLLAKNVPEWENLSTLQKNALLDIQYNIRGNVWTKFPSFTKAVINKDWQNVVIHGSRAEYGNKPNQRNTAFYKSIIEPMVEEWRPEIRNPDASFLNPEFIEINKHVAKRDNTMVGQNSFGGWEEGSKVTHPEIGPEVDVSWNPSAVDMTPFLNTRVNEYQIKFPNYSDQDIYKYYLESTIPDQQNVMLPTVQNRGNSTMVTPVPFYSTHFSTSMDTPNLYKPTGEKCVAYGRLEEGCAGGIQLAMEFNTDLSRNGVRNVNGIQGSAWEMHSNVLAAGGQSLFNYSDDMDTEYMRSNPNEIDADYLLSRYNNARSNRGNQAQLNEGLLQVGDMVDLFYAHSSYQADALVNGKGSNVNSHVGVITEGPNGKLYVTHNVKGTWFSDDLESMLNTQRMKNGKGHRVMIVGGYRPQYETGLVDGISIHPDKRSEVDAKAGMYTGWDGAVATDYLNNLGLVMPDIQTDFNLSDSDATLIAEASYGTFGAESTFAEGGRYEHKSWAREFLRGYKDADNEPETFWDNFKMPNLAFRLLGKDITEGKLDMDDLSEGMTQIKHRAFMEDEYVSQLFLNYGISDPDSLYTPAGASRGTALVHTMNLDLINNLFKDHNLSPQTKKNMLFKAYNAGFDNVLLSFVDEEKGIITPESFEKGRQIYAERHLDKKSMTYLPNQLNKLISFDYSKLKQGKREIDNYSIETMSGFETMFFDMNNKLDELSTKVSDKVDVKVTKGEQKLHRGIKKVERFLDKGYKTKKIKFLKKADDLMNKLYETSNSSIEKIKDKSESVNTQLKNENKKVKNTLNRIKNKVSSIF